VFLTGKQCEVYSAPFDVKISDDTVVQPDISVICDQDKLTDAGCTGAPDMIIEILSPSNSSYDTIVKLNKYISCGVREYWLVDIQHQAILVYLFKDGTVDSLNTYTFHDDIPVHSLPGCLLNLKDVADDENLEDG
jgi:Uma2 family endonuclease